MTQSAGVLYVVATPMGNLADISQRALDTLGRVALIAAEDTRHTAVLLAHYGLRTPLTACHEHNEARLVPRLLERLTAGEDLALVSDAGTPLISDPGYPLVAAARAAGIRVVPLPGPNAAICALSAAGLPSDRFLFLGFPPRAQARRRDQFSRLAREPGTLIFYEAGNRVLATLGDLAQALGARRRAVVARELTKRFETFLPGTLEELLSRIRGDADQQRGEFVVLVAGCRDQEATAAEGERVLRILARHLPLKQAAALAAEISGDQKNRLYALGLKTSAELGMGQG
ncbi:MAG: 16S rRNA (cytidine(1402)-2'-O)-methyltransferase [Chromatiaceae bacterium]|nr:16S rRNA (cytidine(1402)-2'-O)-methyltransferase [Candidatus Thioaporhodococcus sediminis]